MRAVRVFQHDIRIQIKLIIKPINLSQYLLYLKPRDISHSMLDMRTDIADAVRNPRDRRLLPPSGELIDFIFFLAKLIDKPFLRILRIHVNNPADFPVLNELPSQLHHDITRIGVSHTEQQLFLSCQLFELLGLPYLKAQRFFADYIKALSQESLRNVVMHIVGCYNHNEINPILA